MLTHSCNIKAAACSEACVTIIADMSAQMSGNSVPEILAQAGLQLATEEPPVQAEQATKRCLAKQAKALKRSALCGCQLLVAWHRYVVGFDPHEPTTSHCVMESDVEVLLWIAHRLTIQRSQAASKALCEAAGARGAPAAQ